MSFKELFEKLGEEIEDKETKSKCFDMLFSQLQQIQANYNDYEEKYKIYHNKQMDDKAEFDAMDEEKAKIRKKLKKLMLDLKHFKYYMHSEQYKFSMFPLFFDN